MVVVVMVVVVVSRAADLFRAKIEVIDLGIFFPKYTGRKAHFQDGVEFIKELFLERSKHGVPHHPPTHGHHHGLGNSGRAGSPHHMTGSGGTGFGSGIAAHASGRSKTHHQLLAAAGATNGTISTAAAPPPPMMHPYSSPQLHLQVTGSSAGSKLSVGGSSAASAVSRSNLSAVSRSNLHSHASSSGDRRRPKVVYTHVTDATNTETVGIVWRVSINHILEENSKRNGELS